MARKSKKKLSEPVKPKANPTPSTVVSAELASAVYEIRTPVANFHGSRLGVNFTGGVGFTADPAVALRLADMGFSIARTN